MNDCKTKSRDFMHLALRTVFRTALHLIWKEKNYRMYGSFYIGVVFSSKSLPVVLSVNLYNLSIWFYFKSYKGTMMFLCIIKILCGSSSASSASFHVGETLFLRLMKLTSPLKMKLVLHLQTKGM